MKIIHLLAAGAASLGIAAPAVAQTYYPAPQQAYPQYQYPQQQQAYPQYQYPQTQQQGYAYPQQGYAYPQQGYAQPGYGQQNPLGQIINQLLGNRYSVTDRTAVTQCASAAMARAATQYRPRVPQNYGQGYGYPGYQGYNQASSARVTAITEVRRLNRGVRVSGMMSSGMQTAYAPQGYGNRGYANQGYAMPADLNFRCTVDYRGAVTNVRIGRNSAYRR